MATPSTTFTEMVSTTLRHQVGEVTDNVSAHNALLRKLKQKGKIKTIGGGYEAQIPLEYAENSTYTRYSGYDQLNTNASDVITSAKYDWAQVAIHVTANGKELRQNSGEDAMINLVKTRKANAIKTAANNFSIDLYSDGALSNQIGGLAHVIQSNGQGTVGGIVSNTWTFWRNQFREIASSNAYTKDTIQGEFNALWMSLVRGADAPDLIVLSHDFHAVWEASQQQYMRYTNRDATGTANVGFEGYKYKGADVIFDANTNFTTTAEKGYFLNTDYLYLVQHKEAQWTPDDEKKPINQDAVVVPMYWMGFLACSNRARQGVLLDAS
jgi:hypothetical protein